MFAYRVQEYQVVGGPAWISKDQFDNEYLIAENRILRGHLRCGCGSRIRSESRWPRLPDGLDLKRQKNVAQVAKPDTILAWYRRLIAQKFDGSRHRGDPGRPRVCSEIEALVKMARENWTWEL